MVLPDLEGLGLHVYAIARPSVRHTGDQPKITQPSPQAAP